MTVTLPPGVSAKLAGAQLLPRGGAGRRGGQQRRWRGGRSELPAFELPRRRQRHRRVRALADPDRRQGLPRGPLQGRTALPGGRYPRHGRALRSRHGRGQGGAVRRPRNGAGQRGLRSAPARLRRRPARHPLDRGAHRPTGFLAQPDPLCAAGGRGDAARRRGRSERPGVLQRLRRDQLLPGARLQGAGLPSEALPALVRRPPPVEEPEAAGGPRGAAWRRQHRPRRGHPAARADPRPGQPVEGLHPGAVRRRGLPEEVDLRLRAGLHAAARRAAQGPRLPALLQTTSCPTWSPTCAGRSRSSSTAARTAPAGASAAPSTRCPTCRSRSSS